MKKSIILSLVALSLTSNISQSACPVNGDYNEEEALAWACLDSETCARAKTIQSAVNGDLNEEDALRIALALSSQEEDEEDMFEEIEERSAPIDEAVKAYSTFAKSMIGGAVVSAAVASALAVDHFYFGGAYRASAFTNVKAALEHTGLDTYVKPVYHTTLNYAATAASAVQPYVEAAQTNASSFAGKITTTATELFAKIKFWG